MSSSRGHHSSICPSLNVFGFRLPCNQGLGIIHWKVCGWGRQPTWDDGGVPLTIHTVTGQADCKSAHSHRPLLRLPNLVRPSEVTSWLPGVTLSLMLSDVHTGGFQIYVLCCRWSQGSFTEWTWGLNLQWVDKWVWNGWIPLDLQVIVVLNMIKMGTRCFYKVVGRKIRWQCHGPHKRRMLET